jgi:hypothetical protein
VDWSGVRERVEALAELTGRGLVFGSSGHRFVLDPILSEAELAELEGQAGVRLPADYRGFLGTVGRGGAGPSYGVFTLERGDDGRWAWCGDGGDLVEVARLAEPFPEFHPLDDEMSAHDGMIPSESGFATSDEYDEAYTQWDDRRKDLLWDQSRTVGAICLCHLGCASREWLVISGPERGRMWSDYRAEDYDLSPITTPAGEPVTFADWYLEWLETAEAKAIEHAG